MYWRVGPNSRVRSGVIHFYCHGTVHMPTTQAVSLVFRAAPRSLGVPATTCRTCISRVASQSEDHERPHPPSRAIGFSLASTCTSVLNPGPLCNSAEQSFVSAVAFENTRTLVLRQDHTTIPTVTMLFDAAMSLRRGRPRSTSGLSDSTHVARDLAHR